MNRIQFYRCLISSLENNCDTFHKDAEIFSKLNTSDIEYLKNHLDLFLHNNFLVDYLLGYKNIKIAGVKTGARYNKDITIYNSWGDRGDRDEYDHNAINTQYKYFQAMIKQLELRYKNDITIADMGCCIGRLGLMIGEMYPKINYIGYEYWKERIEQASIIAKDKYPNVKYQHADFTDPKLNLAADVYFIYWPNNNNDVMVAMINNIIKSAKPKEREPILVFHRSSEPMHLFPLKKAMENDDKIKNNYKLSYYRIDWEKVNQERKAA